MAETLNEGKIMYAHNSANDKALHGSILGRDFADEMVENNLKSDDSLVEKVNSLIRWQDTKSATRGFIRPWGNHHPLCSNPR